MLTKAARTTLGFTWWQPNVDFREVQVPVYINGCKSGLNQLWFERAACWKRQEVSDMLITHWNAASRALPAFALKSNYLDSWPSNSPPLPQDDHYLSAACLLARSYFCKKASKIIIEMIACCRFSPLLEEETIGIWLDKEDPQVTLAVLNLLTNIVKSPSITSLLCSHQGEISLGIDAYSLSSMSLACDILFT